jgi:hypothetical protein
MGLHIIKPGTRNYALKMVPQYFIAVIKIGAGLKICIKYLVFSTGYCNVVADIVSIIGLLLYGKGNWIFLEDNCQCH